MSKFTTIVADNSQDLFSQLKKLKSQSLVIVLNSNAKVNNDDINEVVANLLLNDPRVGFVYTDVLLCHPDGTQTVEYFSGFDLLEIPFFMRVPDKIEPFSTDTPHIDLMNQLTSQGYYFEHIADPMITVTL